MLNIVFGRENAPEGYVLDTRWYFEDHYKDEWFEDSFVQEFISNVDKAVHVVDSFFRARNGKPITASSLSTGCKTLCCIYFEEDRSKYFYGTAMGRNCIPYMCKVACKKEVNLFVEHYMVIPEEYYELGIVHVDGRLIPNEDEYMDLYSSWLTTVVRR